MKKPICKYLNLGIVEYQKAHMLQRKMVKAVSCNEFENVLILLEHPPVITLGRKGKKENILVSTSELAKSGIELYYIERGGDITYHGPGQIVGYPIINLNYLHKDLHFYLRTLEEVLILLLKDYKIYGKRIKGYTGVWVEDEKIAAIGVAARNWVTFHGFSLNVNPDLSHFSFIHPCGIKDKGVTSMEKLLGRKISIQEVKEKLLKHFGEVLGFETKYFSL